MQCIYQADVSMSPNEVGTHIVVFTTFLLSTFCLQLSQKYLTDFYETSQEHLLDGVDAQLVIIF